MDTPGITVRPLIERGVGHQVPALFEELAKLRTIAQREPGADGRSLCSQDDFRRRFAELEIEALAASLTEQRLVYSLATGKVSATPPHR